MTACSDRSGALDKPAAPVAEARPHEVASPNGTRQDEYYWLRDDTRSDPAVIGYLDDVPAGAHLLFSAHGVGPERWAHAERLKLEVIDATCPLVEKVHYEARRFASKDFTIVLVGEEIPEIPYHLVAVGIHTTVDSALTIAEQIDEIHRQGGIAIAAHPGEFFWPGFEPVMDRLDGTELCHPAAFDYPQFRPELEEFAKKTNAAAIGSSDFHGPGRLGLCRTFVFAGEASAEAVLEAIRARRTVVYGRDNHVYGDPELIRIAEADGRLRRLASTEYPVSALGRISQMLGIAGLALIVLRSSARAGAAVRQR